MYKELTERDQMIQLISDMHKDAYGFRPRGDTSEMTMDDLEAEIVRLSTSVDRAILEEKEREREDIAAFERTIQTSIESGAKDRETAVRWLWEAFKVEADGYATEDYFKWCNGLPCEYDLNTGELQKLYPVTC